MPHGVPPLGQSGLGGRGLWVKNHCKIIKSSLLNKTVFFVMEKAVFIVMAIKINHLLCRCVPKKL